MKIYLVGGIIRDRLLGVESNDYDYSVVLPQEYLDKGVDWGFKYLQNFLQGEGYTIYSVKKQFYTIKAKFPEGHIHEGLTADFVLARKEVGYKEGTREPILELGTLYDDLERRDFTINALAEDIDNPGEIIDYFQGMVHLQNKILTTPKDAYQTMIDDPLRLLRAFRFSVTKNMKIHFFIKNAVKDSTHILSKLTQVVSQERIQTELNKMFKYDTEHSMRLLINWDKSLDYKLLPILFKQGYYLQMTNKQK